MNKKGFPVLPRVIQRIVHRFVALNIQVVIEGRSRGQNMSFYQAYIDHLWQLHNNEDDPLKHYAKGFEDMLQVRDSLREGIIINYKQLNCFLRVHVTGQRRCMLNPSKQTYYLSSSSVPCNP